MNTQHMRHIPLEEGAIAALLDAWQSKRPATGVIALLPEARKQRLPLLQAACRARGLPLAGGIFPALVADDAFSTEGAWLLQVDGTMPTFLLEDVNGGPGEGAARIVQATQAALAALPAGAAQPTLYLVFDGLLPNIATLLDGLYLGLADRVRYAGVNAGSETFQPMPCLFDAWRVVGNGVLGLLLPGQSVTVLEHGYATPALSMTATATDGNRIRSIDWRPAFEAYQQVIQAEYGIELTPENFYQHAVHFPFGILRANEEVVVRIPVALADDRSLVCVGEVPENAMLVLLRAPQANEGQCIDHLARELAAANGPLAGSELLSFYCAGRRMHLGEAATSELARLREQTGVACMGGALSLGEVGSTRAWSYPLFHNATLVCTPWRSP